MKIPATLGLAIFCLATLDPVRADTNPPAGGTGGTSYTSPQSNLAVVTTNLVTAAANFRRVNGQLYNTQKSRLWECFSLEVESKYRGLVIARTYELKKQTYSSGGGHVTGNQRAGAYIGGPGPSSQTVTWKDYGKTTAITNLPDYANIASDERMEIWLMRVGTLNDPDFGRAYELWDRGTPNIVPVITTNRQAADGVQPAGAKARK